MVNIPFYADISAFGVKMYAPGGCGFVTEREIGAYPELKVPEVNSGFTPVWWYEGRELTQVESADGAAYAVPGKDARAEDLEGRELPLWFKADVEPGHYEVTVTLTAREDTERAVVFTGRRHIAWMGKLKAGERRTVRVLCDVAPIIAVGGGDAAAGDLGRRECRAVDLCLVGAGLADIKIEKYEGPAMFLMGDSTVTDQPAVTPYAPGVNYAGWGQALQLYVGTEYLISNHAHSGLSTETFRDMGHYELMLEQVRPGDKVLIQFGHNDQKRLHLAADTGYTENLLRFIRELREAGAEPILVTSLARNTWASEKKYNDMLFPYAEAVKRIGERESVKVCDLHGKMKAAILDAGMEGAKPWFHPCDYTHPNDFGAHMIAGFVAAELERLGVIKGENIGPWPVRPPLEGLKRPPEEEIPEGMEIPPESPPLVDYGMIPGAPWPIT